MISQQTFFFMVLEAEESKVKMPTDLVSGEGSLPGLQMAISSLRPHVMEREGTPALYCLFP